MQRRLTIAEDSHLRTAWSVLVRIADPCKEILGIQQSIYDMLHHNTTDGRPYVEPPLTDEDAIKRPLVKVKDNEEDEWGRFVVRLVYVKPQGSYFRFTVEDPADDHAVLEWKFARRATPEEIAAAGLEVTE
jgi:hypothetical protein